jgi:hypothetical protein
MTSPFLLKRVAAMLSAYESRSIDVEELHQRLLKALPTNGSADATLAQLIGAVDEASDLGQSEREDVAWAAARFWRRTVDGS